MAAALAPDIPEEDLARIEGPLNGLEAAFRPLAHQAPHDTEPVYVLLLNREDS